MIFKIGDMELQIEKSWYNKMKVQEDGITQEVDTSKRYDYYQFGMGKNYLDVKNKEDMLRQLIGDLKMVTAELEKQLGKQDIEREKE